jgi:hypothetical protein
MYDKKFGKFYWIERNHIYRKSLAQHNFYALAYHFFMTLNSIKKLTIPVSTIQKGHVLRNLL